MIEINFDICTKCGLCVKDCFFKAIEPETFSVIERRCTYCGHCVSICPVNAVSSDKIQSETLKSIPPEFSDNLLTLIKNRRSIRLYKEEDVESAIVDKIIDAVSYTPTGTNSCETSVTVIARREKVKSLSDRMIKFFITASTFLFNPITYPFLTLFAGKTMTKKLFGYKRRLLKNREEQKDLLTHYAPLLFIFHADVKKSAVPSQDTIIKATAGLYYAESLGLGTCFNGFVVIGLNANKKLKKLAGIPESHKVYETFTAGWPAVKYKRTFKRNL